jgi:two-component system, response regulator YesN
VNIGVRRKGSPDGIVRNGDRLYCDTGKSGINTGEDISMALNARLRENKKRILVVEDDPDLMELHLTFLSGRFTLLAETSGRNALQHLKKKHDIHLAVIDFMLPDMSGIDVLKELKKTRPFVPVIFMSAFGNEDVAVQAFRCGARDYVKKPFAYHELIKRIDFCLSLNDIEQKKQRKALTNETEEIAGSVSQGVRAVKKNTRIQQALNFIHSNYSAEINLDRVAETAGVSRYHFSRIFKEMTGLTYPSYLNRIRIEQAKTLLGYDDALSITDVGYSVGYSDLRHFEKIFKRAVGFTPLQFKRQSSALKALSSEEKA